MSVYASCNMCGQSIHEGICEICAKSLIPDNTSLILSVAKDLEDLAVRLDKLESEVWIEREVQSIATELRLRRRKLLNDTPSRRWLNPNTNEYQDDTE